MKFKLIREGGDTRINEYSDDYFKEGDDPFDTFEQAQAAAIIYLEFEIFELQETLKWIKVEDE